MSTPGIGRLSGRDQRRRLAVSGTGRPDGTAPRGTLTSLTTLTVRAGLPPLAGMRTGVTTRTTPGRGRATRPPARTTRTWLGWRRTVTVRPRGRRRGATPR